MVQVTGVGMGLLNALFLAAVVSLATGRGGETEALWIFPAWALIFIVLIWRATNWRQTLARGLAFLGAEFLAIPLAWLAYQGTPSLSSADPRLSQTLSVLAMGLSVAALLLFASFFLWFRGVWSAKAAIKRGLLVLAVAVFGGEAVYGLLLLTAYLRS